MVNIDYVYYTNCSGYHKATIAVALYVHVCMRGDSGVTYTYMYVHTKVTIIGICETCPYKYMMHTTLWIPMLLMESKLFEVLFTFIRSWVYYITPYV